MNIKERSLALLDFLFGPSEDERMELGVRRELAKHPAPKPRKPAPLKKKTITCYPVGYKFSPDQMREALALAKDRAMMEMYEDTKDIPMPSVYSTNREDREKLELAWKKYDKARYDIGNGKVDPWYEFNEHARRQLPGDDCRNSCQPDQLLFRSYC